MKNLCLVLLIVCSLSYGQTQLPKDYFNNPLEIPLILSGSFGELRSNHFHSGLDIKTQQKEGLPIYAPADGFVNRIKVAHYGYGKALYIKHPNGYVTVYAHLQKYAGAIQDFVKQKQYQNESFEIELFPEPEQLAVMKGDIIGYTGNSGSSGGPHLHFEIRDASSRPMNPMLFGVEIADTKKPQVNTVMAYPIDELSHVNGSQNPVKLRLIMQKDGSYKAESITALGRIGFGVSTYDQQDGASNKNGVYQIKTVFNGQERYNILFEKFSFDETRYLNHFIDYSYFKKNRSRVQKLFRQANNPLSIIKNEVDNGYVIADDGYTANFTIDITDFRANSIQISIPIDGKEVEITQPRIVEPTSDFIFSDQATSISKGKFEIYIPSNSLYENTYLDIQVKGDTLKFHKNDTPIHKNITLTADASNYSSADISKLFIGRLNYKGEPYFNNTSKKGNKLIARVRTFGNYVLVADMTPPLIKAANFNEGKWITKNSTLKMKIEDDMSGVSSYRATVNGKYILMEYNYKTDVLTYDFNDNVTIDGENNFKLNVIDNVGNNSTFETTFFRKKS